MRLADYTPARLAVLMAILRSALCLLFAFAPLVGRRTRRAAIEQATRWAETFIFIAAYNRAAPVNLTKATKRPRFAPFGFRRVVATPQEMFRRSGLRGGSLTARLDRLLAVLADPEPVIVRAAARLARFARLVATAPAQITLAATDASVHVGFTDSS